MSQAPGGPGINIRGAVDLSAANRPPASAADQQAAAGDGGVIIDVQEAAFPALVETSMTVPVVIDLWATWCEPCKQLTPILEKLAIEYGGRFLLAKIDVDENPAIAQAFQVQSVPSVVAILKGQPVPLFQGAMPEAEVRAVLDQLLEIAQSNGVTETIAVGDTETQEPPVVPEAPLPPRHQEAFDAMERDDLDGAVAAYQAALRENPADDDARLGLAHVDLIRRTATIDAVAVLERAEANPRDVEAQLGAADIELLSGAVEEAFARLITTIQLTQDADRDLLRARLLELFDITGADDPRVISARRKLTSALY